MMGTIYLLIASIIWGLVHSVLASHAFKHNVRKIFGPPAFFRYYRFSYNLFAVASFLPIMLILITIPDHPLYSIAAPFVYATTILQGLAVFALMAGVMKTGLWEFIGLSQLSPAYDDIKPAGLVVDGLYAYVRHPLYTAGLVFLWLSPDMSINRLVLWIVLTAYTILGAYFEERKLMVDFGNDYAEYKSRTPMFIPAWHRNS